MPAETPKTTVEKSVLRTEAIYSEDKIHRYLLRKEWGKGKKALVLMTNASTSGMIVTDYTTQFVVNNLFRLGFEGCEICNIFSRITTKVSTKGGTADLYTAENMEQIKKSAEVSETIVVAWGALGDSNKQVKSVQEKILEILLPFKEKLFVIADKNGKKEGHHPLSAAVRDYWVLKPFTIPPKASGRGKQQRAVRGNG